MGITVTDNIDSILKATAQLESKAMTEMVRESRKAMRKEFNKNKPFFKQVTPKKTGKARKSIKVKSRTKRGVTTMRMIWDLPYSNPMNFKRGTSSEAKVTNGFKSQKSRLDRDISRAIVTAQKDYLKSRGFKVK